MALSASEVYNLNADELRKACEERGLDTSGPVKTLRERLAEFVKGSKMEEPAEVKAAQTGVQIYVADNVVRLIRKILVVALMKSKMDR
jgi:hypothetical protein